MFPYSDKAWLYTNAGYWSYATEPSDSDIGQIDIVSGDPAAEASFATSFASTLYGLTSRPVGIIPCAKGGATIDAWSRVAGLGRDTLYGSMIARAHEAAARGVLKGIIYYQGEGDTFDMLSVMNWPAKFLQWCADVRTDLNMPELPIIMTVIGRNPFSPTYPFWDEMIAIQQQFELPHHCTRVFATDLSVRPESGNTYLSTSAQVILGQRYAVAFCNELGLSIGSAEPEFLVDSDGYDLMDFDGYYLVDAG